MEAKQGSLEKPVSGHLDEVLSTVGSPPSPVGRTPARHAPLDILIPAPLAVENLQRCLNALLGTLTKGDTVWLIDDVSGDERVSELIRAFGKQWRQTHCITNHKKLEYVALLNKGISLTRRDLVLLHSNAEPTLGWLEHLQDCMRRNPRAGIVCPLSHQATTLSVPEAEPEHLELFASKVAAATVGTVRIPAAGRECMLLRRQCLRRIGNFCPAFAPGHGEEIDLSMRALRAGWDICVADRACVFIHSGPGSVPAQSPTPKSRQEGALERIWPEYRPLFMSWWKDNPLRIKIEHASRPSDHLPGVLHVLHRKFHIGGTERVARTLTAALADRYVQTLVYPGATDNVWSDVELRASGNIRELMINNRWIKPSVMIAGMGADLTCPHSERVFARLLLGSDARIVHFHHLLHWDTLLLPAIANRLGCRTVISVHDFWFNCPIHNQLEHSGREPCGRSHAVTDARCGRCLLAYCGGTLHSGAGARNCDHYVELRHALISDALQKADAVIVPSLFMRERVRSAFPDLDCERLLLEPHGTEVPQARRASSLKQGRVVAFFGGDETMKGAEIVMKLARALLGAPVHFRIFGRIRGYDPRDLPSNITLVGFYRPDEVGSCLEGIDLALLPSFYEESFSLVASECWAHGVPVLASARGALQHRVVPGENGWLVPDMQADSWEQSLRSVLNGDQIERCAKRLATRKIVSIKDSSSRMDRLYQRLLGETGARPSKRNFGDTAPAFDRALRELRCSGISLSERAREDHYLGVIRDDWGTAAYRVRFPLEDMQRADLGRISLHVVKRDGFVLDSALTNSHAGHVVIQPFVSDEGLRMMENLHREAGFDVTLVIDDLWTNLHSDNPLQALMPKDVAERLTYAASLSQTLVFTTDELERCMNLEHENTCVINNALPGWIWKFASKSEARRHQRLRVGWAGAPQHDTDLRFLRDVVLDTRDLADWVFFGACLPELQDVVSEIHPMVPFGAYPARLAALNLDLAIAPLSDTPFNRCKSHLKLLEYGALGLPVVASDLEPYRNSPAILAAPDDPAEWAEKIHGLLKNEERRYVQGNVMRKWVFNNHMTRHRRADWKRALGRKCIAEK